MKHKYSLLLVPVFFLIIACSSDKSSSKPLKVNGSIGAGFTSSSGKMISSKSSAGKLALPDSFVDTVMAIPINNPFVSGEWIMEDAVTSPIGADGSFNVSIDTSKDWILLLIDSTAADRKNQLVAFAALGDDSAGNDSMMLIPATESVSDVNMGTLARSGDEAVQSDSMSENETNFSLNISELRQIAQNDNILKTIKNIYVNYDPATNKFYSALLVFWWDADAKLSMNSYSDPADYTFSGYQPSFNSRNDSSFPYEGVKNKDFIVSITPPSSVTDTNSNTYTSFDNNCTLTEEMRGDNKWYVGSNNPPFGFGIDYTHSSIGWIQMGAGGCRFKDIVTGWWSIQKDGIEKAAFDLGVCSPLNSSTGIPYVYLPSLKINVDGSDNVVSFEIKWYRYNPSTSQYEEITDISSFKNLMEWVGMNYNDTLSNSEICDFSSVTTIKVYPKKTWKFTGTSSGAYDISSIILGYRIYGVDFDINLRP